MRIVKTPSFEIAVNEYGDPNSSKIAMLLPGKLDTKDYAHMISHCEMLAKLGYFAISIDPPGCWDSKGDISYYTTSNYIKAVHELIEYFGNKPTLLVGHSLGGGVAALVAVNNVYVSAFCMIMSPFFFKSYFNTRKYKKKGAEWKNKGYADSKRDIPGSDPIEWRYYKLPFRYLEDQARYNMKPGLASCNKPKLIIYATHDKSISPRAVKKAYAVSSYPKVITEINAQHDYRRDSIAISAVNEVIRSFVQSLG